MNFARRLDAIEAALAIEIVGEHCNTCGTPERAKRRDRLYVLIGDQRGTCEACGRPLDMRDGGRPIVGGKIIHLIRGTQPKLRTQ